MKILNVSVIAAVLCGHALLSSAALAADYPTKPIRIVVGFAAGGPTDVIARIIAQDMTAMWGQAVVVDNRTGANSLIATETVAQATPDGYTLETSSASKMTHVPFRGNAPALTEVIAGRVSFMFYPMIGIQEYVQSKRLKVLAAGTAKRHPDYSSVPTMAESGFPGFEDTAPWIGLLAPARTPEAVVAGLNDAVRKSIAKPESKKRLEALGAITIGNSPSEFTAFLQKDWDRWARVIKAAGVKAE